MARGHIIAQYLVTALIALGLGVAYLAVYGLYGQNSCLTQLPVWVLVSGISIIIGWVVSLGMLKESLKNADLPYTERATKGPETRLGKASNGLTSIINLFNFCWFIVGNVWTFSITAVDCDPTLYMFCFVIIIIQWCLVGLICVILCAVIAVACCLRK